MSDNVSDIVKPARILLGGPSGCIGYTNEELRVLSSILNGGVSLRNAVVHRALRIMCQAVIADPDGGYPSTLAELERGLGVPGLGQNRVPASARVSLQAAATPEASEDAAIDSSTPDWLIEKGSERVEEVKPEPEEDPEIARQRSAVSAFMG